jgi:hypothetical protein
LLGDAHEHRIVDVIGLVDERGERHDRDGRHNRQITALGPAGWKVPRRFGSAVAGNHAAHRL